MSKIKIKSYFENLHVYKQGKSLISGVSKIIKLSSNENALGCSNKALEAYKFHAKDISRYSDGSALKLREVIGEKYDIFVNNIICGAGSDEIISIIANCFVDVEDEVLYSEHGFLMYPISAMKFGGLPIKIKDKEYSFSVTNCLNLINNKTKLVFIANPNNPTGSYIGKDKLNCLIEKLPENIILVIDLAYEEFVDIEKYPDYPDFDYLKNIVKKKQNIILLKTFSKAYGLASLRIGWAYSSSYIIESLNKAKGPFNVCGPAQEAAIAAIKDEEFINKSFLHNKKWLEIFEEKKYRNIKLHKTVCNFIMAEFMNIENCAKANEELQKEGLIVRMLDEYCLSKFFRFTIGSDEECKKLIEILDKIDDLLE